jgi:hypothetical protein
MDAEQNRHPNDTNITFSGVSFAGAAAYGGAGGGLAGGGGTREAATIGPWAVPAYVHAGQSGFGESGAGLLNLRF